MSFIWGMIRLYGINVNDVSTECYEMKRNCELIMCTVINAFL